MLNTYLPLAQRMLEQTELTGQLCPATLQSLLHASAIRRHPAGVMLSRRGEPVHELLFVLEGSLEVSIAGVDGRRSICWYLAPGQWMGLIPVLDGQDAIHDLRVHHAAVLLHTPREAFLRTMQADQHLAQMCIRILCARSRSLYDNQAAETLLPLRARVARLLLMLAGQHGRDCEQGIEISLKLSQDEFADMLGVTRQSLNRELKSLEKLGLIRIAYSRITLHDGLRLRGLAALTETAQSDNTRKQ